MNLICYTRVSTKQQGESGLSLGAQRDACEAWCRGMGHDIVSVVKEVASGGENRPLLNEAVQEARRGSLASGIVAVKLDRVTRSVKHLATLLDDAQKNDWSLIAVRDGLDTQSASGRLVANIMVSVAEWERSIISERTREALAQKQKQGIRLGRPPAFDLTSDQIRKIVDLRAAGCTLRECAAAAGVSVATVRRVV